MAKNQSKRFRIKSGSGHVSGPAVVDAKSILPDDDGFINVDLNYYNGKPECFSVWGKAELKAFTKWVATLKTQKPSTISRHSGLSYKPHKAAPKLKGCARPEGLSPELTFYEMRAGGKARVHGILVGTTFYLVWLDRNHAVFPSGK